MTYRFVVFAAISLSFFSTLTPYFLKIIVDDYIRLKDYSGMLFFIILMLATLLLEVIFQFLFVFYANWLGQSVIKDLRLRLFDKIINFKMAYFASLNSFVQERISGIKIVQLFNREKIEYKNFLSINEKHKKAWLKTVWFNSIFPVAEIASSVTIGLIVWYGGFNILSNGKISLGVIFLFIQMSQMLFRPLRQIADKFNSLQMGMVAAERIFRIIETKSAIKNNGNIIAKSVRGKINFKKLKFSYVSGQTVLNNFSLNIRPGEKIAIVGATGSENQPLLICYADYMILKVVTF